MKELLNEYVDDKTEVTKCESQYSMLLECLNTYDRKWAKCQDELKKFRTCYSEENRKKRQLK
ncbi:hypothetical protein PGO_010450 [Plasmodium gonderi]|uniref:CHCH domain-containing protein n=1 Tax=Plasmodium gonderi TaxID=77519 RepID=A0A1Y1J8R3_PLAGO|nr:hypothetical protein PGO_010450 [Plasmodium gonderi]GAW78901.1 hypothetical protein PGO_010450 [Plasmodium gonderi]